MDDSEEPKRRWYRLTPDRLVLGVLALEAFLLLSQWQSWFAFGQHRGWSVLTAVAAAGLTLLLLSLWFVASLLFRWRFQYSLRSLLLLVVAVAVPCSWLATEMQRAEGQRDAVAAVKATGGELLYDIGPEFHGWMNPPTPHCPQWLRRLFGDDFFSCAAEANVNSDAGMAAVIGLNELETINLSGPAITDAALVNLHKFRKLNILSLDHTDVTDAGLENVSHLRQLWAIDLSHTKISDFGLTQLERLSKLRSLYLSSTDITDAGLAQLQCWPHLQFLDLGHTKITGFGLKNAKSLLQLISLDLTGTNVADDGLKQIESLPQLTHLNLTGTKITDAGLAHLQKLNRIEMLWLERTEVTDAGLQYLQGLHNLTYLNLANTKVTDAGLVYLKGLSQLSELWLCDNWNSKTTVTDDGVRMLERALPKCLIYSASEQNQNLSTP
jgi:hypothetical protein